jgi:ubiquitin carboxyl-terminal hydrolase 25/28
LGVEPNSSDGCIIDAYKQNVETDAEDTVWHLSCLNKIANIRQSEELGVLVATEQSKGLFTIEQVRQAYRYFGFTREDVDEEHIIGTYKSRLSDAPRQDSEMREQLRIIGQHRQSLRIKDVAKGSK